MFEIAKLYLEQGIAVSVEGVELPITAMMDRFGEDTDDPAECCIAMVRTPRHYVTVPVTEDVFH